MNIAVSACLLGTPCRYDGTSVPCDSVRALASEHTLVPVCPEVLGGLPTPRPCAELQLCASTEVAPEVGAEADTEIFANVNSTVVAEIPAKDGTQISAGAGSKTGAAIHTETDSDGDARKGASANTDRSNGPLRVVNAAGEDVTSAFEQGAQVALDQALQARCTCAILKSKSPSCGSSLVYDGTFSGTLVPGEGVTAKLFRAANLPVYDELHVADCLQAHKAR